MKQQYKILHFSQIKGKSVIANAENLNFKLNKPSKSSQIKKNKCSLHINVYPVYMLRKKF